MKLSQLMALPMWAGQIFIKQVGETVQLQISEDGQSLNFKYKGSGFQIQDQNVTVYDAGTIYLYIRSQNRMLRTLPASIVIHLVDKEGNFITAETINEYTSYVPLQGYYGQSHIRVYK